LRFSGRVIAAPVSPRAIALDGPVGYDPRLFIDDVDSEYICSLCHNVLRHAVVISNDSWYDFIFSQTMRYLDDNISMYFLKQWFCVLRYVSAGTSGHQA
jgi:hypothetical protein